MELAVAPQSWAKVQTEGSVVTIFLLGPWLLENLEEIWEQVSFPQVPNARSVTLNGKSLEALDTASALLFFQLMEKAGLSVKQLQVSDCHAEHVNILQLVRDKFGELGAYKKTSELNLIRKIGFSTEQILKKFSAFIAFLGESTVEIAKTVLRPQNIRGKEFFVQLERVFSDAVPIIALVTFLIGVVIAYLFAMQIEKYGANIFIVDAVALAMCRELSPIIVAIIVAGRSGSAFTAQIGTMKLNEEVDALVTLGLSPMQVLVLPRIFALVVSMPLLVFVGDVVGILGGIFIADVQLGITGATFIERLHTVLPLRSFFVGLVKAPVFAMFIAVIACRMGFCVENNARSVGLNTTSTVVQSLVSVIILNAIFAVVFVELGI